MTKRSWRVGNSNTLVDIDDTWRVLDVGGGHRPHPRANYVAERFIGSNLHRGGKDTELDLDNLVCGDGLHLPFRDKSFDYIITSHVGEHVDDPLRFCQELYRVSERGYFETPNKIIEKKRSTPVHIHHWQISKTSTDTLQFEPNQPHVFGDPWGDFYYQLFHIAYPSLKGEGAWQIRNKIAKTFLRMLARIVLRVDWFFKERTYTRLQWSGPFRVVVLDDGGNVIQDQTV